MVELNSKRNFKGVWIPKEVWTNKELTWMEKLLLVEIDSLDNEDGCFAGNEHFADFFDLSQDRISKLVTSLKRKGFVNVEIQKFGLKKTKRVIKVDKLKFYGADSTRRKQPEGVGENAESSLGENAEYNNTIINNTNNNNNSKVKTSEKVKKTYDINSDEYKLVNVFINQMKKYTNGIFEGPKNLDKWCDAMRLLIDITLKNVSSDRTERCKKAQDIILYVVNDDFHRGNVLSIPKLRTRALEFIVKMDAAEKKKQHGNQPYNNFTTNQQPSATNYQTVIVEDLYK